MSAERLDLAASEAQAKRDMAQLSRLLSSMRWSLLVEIAMLRDAPAFEDQRAVADLLTTASDALGDAVEATGDLSEDQE